MYGGFYYGETTYGNTRSKGRVSVVRKAINSVIMMTRNAVSILASLGGVSIMRTKPNMATLGTTQKHPAVLSVNNQKTIL